MEGDWALGQKYCLAFAAEKSDDDYDKDNHVQTLWLNGYDYCFVIWRSGIRTCSRIKGTLTEVFRSWKIRKKYLKLSHDHFPPHRLQFPVHWLPYVVTLCTLSYLLLNKPPMQTNSKNNNDNTYDICVCDFVSTVNKGEIR